MSEEKSPHDLIISHLDENLRYSVRDFSRIGMAKRKNNGSNIEVTLGEGGEKKCTGDI